MSNRLFRETENVDKLVAEKTTIIHNFRNILSCLLDDKSQYIVNVKSNLRNRLSTRVEPLDEKYIISFHPVGEYIPNIHVDFKTNLSNKNELREPTSVAK